MAHAPLPPGLRTARTVAYVQGGLGVFTGVLFVIGGAGFATALGIAGISGTAAVIAIGVVLTAASGLLLWATRLLAGLSERARTGVLVFEYLSLVLGAAEYADVWQAGLRIALAVVVIYYLQVDRGTRAAFAAHRAARRLSSR